MGFRGRAGLLLGLRRSALPAPGQPDVLRYRRLVAELRPHVPTLRHAVRGRLAGQERQRLRVHDGHPGRSRAAHRRDRVQRPVRRARAARRGIRFDDGRVPRHRPAGLRPGLRRLVARPTPARDGTQLRLPRGATRRGRRDGPGRCRLPPRGRDRRPRSTLEDPLDAQLRPAVGDPQPARGHGEAPRPGRRAAARAAPELRLGPQLGLDRGALADEERGPRRPRAAGRLRGRGGRRDRPRPASRRTRPAVHRRAGRAVPARVRLARRVEPRVHLPDRARADGAGHRARPRLPRGGLRLPERDRGDAARHRGRLARGPRRADRRRARGDARRERRQPADGAAHPRPPLLHRPGRQRARPAGPHRDRPEAGRGRPARPARRRDVPPLQRAARPHRQRVGDRGPRDRRRAPARAGGRPAPPPARLGRDGDPIAAGLPVPRQLGLPGPLPPDAVRRPARHHRPRGIARHDRGDRPRRAHDRRVRRSARGRHPRLPDDEPGMGRPVHQDRRARDGHGRDDLASGRARPRVRHPGRDRDVRGDPADRHRRPAHASTGPTGRVEILRDGAADTTHAPATAIGR